MEIPVVNLSDEELKTVYDPSEDSYLLIDTLEEDLDILHAMKPVICLEIGTSGRITLGFWGCMTSHGLVELTEIFLRMDAEEYVEILEEILKPAIRRIFPEDQYPIVKIAQDNSAVHTSRLVQAWFTENPDIQQIRWPAKSPDLNPIENVWAQMKLSWRAGQLRTRDALRNHVHQVWQQLSQKEGYTEFNSFYAKKITAGNRKRRILDTVLKFSRERNV